MGKIIISEKFLVGNYVPVALAHANALIGSKGLNGAEVQTDINNAKSPEEFVKVFEKHFGDDLKLIHA